MEIEIEKNAIKVNNSLDYQTNIPEYSPVNIDSL
jgi:hypothetical protein